jgi:type III secretion system YscQ/HrcQ family protein
VSPKTNRPRTGTDLVTIPGTAAGKKVHPLVWPRMERLSRQQARLLNRLDWLVPPGFLSGEIPESTRARMRELFDEDVRLWLDYAHVISRDRLKKIISDPTFLATINPSPQGTRGVLEFELGLAHAAIDLLLGAASPGAMALRPLTEIEEGVISYVLLEALKLLVPANDPSRPRLRLERILHGVDEALEVFSDETEVAVVQYKLTVGINPGYFRLFIPGSTIARAAPPPETPERRAWQRAVLQRNIRRLAGVRLNLRAEIARVEIAGREFASLHPGDVLLVEDFSARPDKGQGGKVRLCLGLGRSGRVDAVASLEDGKWRLRVEAVDAGPQPPAARPPNSGEAPVPERHGPKTSQTALPKTPQDDEPVTARTFPTRTKEDLVMAEPGKDGAAALLKDVPLQIAVELGRVPVSAEEIVNIHVGQVLELNKAPGEPVDLSVHGKVVARGELVEVEGQVGVRILSLVS